MVRPHGDAPASLSRGPTKAVLRSRMGTRTAPSYNGGRKGRVLPILPAALRSLARIFMRHRTMWCSGHSCEISKKAPYCVSEEVSCILPHTDFPEFRKEVAFGEVTKGRSCADLLRHSPCL